MRYPPDPIDPSKPWPKELARYAVEMHRYKKALEDGVNDHGPWQEFPLAPLSPVKRISYMQKRNLATVQRIGDVWETYLREGCF